MTPYKDSGNAAGHVKAPKTLSDEDLAHLSEAKRLTDELDRVLSEQLNDLVPDLVRGIRSELSQIGGCRA